MHSNSHHKFHIPVMGLAYTIDSPVKVARFGITSAVYLKRESEIVKYFELLPDDSQLKKIYFSLSKINDQKERQAIEQLLRTSIKPGSIEVNIMTKIDKNTFDKQGFPIEDGSDAVAALRGYAMSNLIDSALIFSAGNEPKVVIII